MIEIKNKENCCGCGACVQRCPKQCIAFKEDEEGFLYPRVDESLCIDCGLCEKVCPILNTDIPREPLAVYAAFNHDAEVRITSSSGGIFSLFAESVIAEGGVVFGAKFNENWEVIHDYSETKEGLAAFRGSKYVQSSIGRAYKDAERFLKEGRKVLFSGTPCQISGLKKFLRKDYENLVTIDFICHGVPSPGVFRWYMAEELANISNQREYAFPKRYKLKNIPLVSTLAANANIELKSIHFRDKIMGWRKFSFSICFNKLKDKNIVFSQSLRENKFILGFLKDLYLRPSCHICPCKGLASGADLTIGDFWGIEKIHPEIDDDKGISALMVNTKKGFIYTKNERIKLYESNFCTLCELNGALMKSSVVPRERNVFFNNIQTTMSFSDNIGSCVKQMRKLRINQIISKSISVLKKLLE